MRIIGGKLSGRTLKSPLSRATRPMLDRVREALFNIIEHHDWGKATGNPLKDANVLDAFCGTGALAFEALSRGAAHATLFDKDRNALRIATENAENLGLKNVCRIMPADMLEPPKASSECRLVFIAPPYRKGLVAPSLAALDVTGWIAANALIIVETAKKEPLELPGNFVPLFSRFYADTALHFVIRAP
jgi:16S rRNA (guanine966-N2)-methyltransferase